MKTIFSILILLSISFNVQADHDGRVFEFDRYDILDGHEITIYIYNKTKNNLDPGSFVWMIGFEDGSIRKYKTKDYGMCPGYSDCTWTIYLNKQGANKVGIAH